MNNLPDNFQEFIERIKWKGIKKADFVEILLQPYRLSKSPEVYIQHRRTIKDIIRIWTYRLIKRPLGALKDKYINWKNDYIKIMIGKGSSVTTNDWRKASFKRPERKVCKDKKLKVF